MVPIVDLSSNDASRSLIEAFSAIGFAELTAHGVDPACSTALRTACDTFFGLPEDEKRRWVHPDPAANRGFRSKGSEALSYSLGEASPPDLFESFNCGSDHRTGTHRLMQNTPWPTTVPALHGAAHRYLEQMEKLSAHLDDLLSKTLGLDLAPVSTRGPDTMACIDYRPSSDGTEPALDGQQRMGAHSDYTSFTILHADPVPGLQIIGPDGGWVDVIPAAGNLLVNVGDVLAMYTNNAWPSTLHRVVPIAAGAAPVRRSVAYFHYPNLDVMIEPLQQFLQGTPAAYEPVTVEAHLAGKLTAPKTHQPATSASTMADRSIADS